jgi:CheY-like chemotaxis protein
MWIDDRVAREHDMSAGQYIAVCISDTGTGMSPDVVRRAFDPFYTTKPAGQGTGLGLSMVHGFAKQSGGQARIYSEVGKGTTVRVYLPRHFGPPIEEMASLEARQPSVATKGQTVLVVDDEPAVRMLITDVLDDLGLESIEASDASSGLKVLQSDVRIDLLITDVGLPGGLNGRQMADAARATRSGLRVLFITGYAENAAMGNGQLEPGMHVLTKPFSMNKLSESVNAILTAQR